MSTLNSYPTADLGTSLQQVYICPDGKTAVVIGSNIANKLSTTITVDIKYRKAGVDYLMLKSVFIPPSVAYVSSGDEQKLILNSGDSIRMQSDTAASADVVISVSEFDSSI